MPTYLFTSEDGETIEKVMCPADMPDEIIVDGTVFKRDLAKELRDGGPGVMRTDAKANSLWPQHSVAAGISPKQVAEDGGYTDPEARKRFPHHKFDKETGDMKFSSMKEKRQHTKDLGLKTSS